MKGLSISAVAILILLINYSNAANNHQGRSFVVGFMSLYRQRTTGFCDILIISQLRATVRMQIPFLNMDRQVVINPLDTSTGRFRLSGTLRMSLNQLESKGIMITSNEDVSVYAFNAGSAGESFLALPVSEFNTTISSYEFIIPAYNALSSTYSLLGVVGYENDTEASIVPIRAGGGHDFDNAISGSIWQFETYQLAIRGGDTTGYLVRTNKPVAVYGGATCSFVPTKVQYCDHLVEQVPPTYTWGTRFISVPIQRRTSGDVYRVLPAENDTSVTVAGYGTREGINRGQYFEFERPSTALNYITCTKPCMLVQYNKGISADSMRGGTDPFMMIVPPIKQYTGPVAFSPFKNQRGQDFNNLVSIVAQKAATGGLTINGETISRDQWKDIPFTDYRTATLTGLVYTSYYIRHWAPGVEYMVWTYGHLGVEAYGHPVGMGMKSTDEGIPTVPPPPTTPAPEAEDFAELCECTIRLEANSTAGETEPTEILYPLKPVWFNNTKGRCEGCAEVMDQCRLTCDQNIRDVYNPDGLYTGIPINGTGGVRFRPLGQVLCEQFLDDIPPPGLRMVSYYQPGTCGELFHTIVNQHGLCCKEVDIPEIGFVVVWDAQCDGDVEFPLAWDVAK